MQSDSTQSVDSTSADEQIRGLDILVNIVVMDVF